jgi:hypothetical protein
MIDSPRDLPSAALAATLHDPEGRLMASLESSTALFSMYAGVYVTATAASDSRIVEALRAAGARVRADGDARAGENRRRAVADALASGASSIFSCDFDRWLHWAKFFPDELAALPTRIADECPESWYVSLGRTSRAYATHPLVQRATEEATNHALSLVLGRGVDATAGASWLTRRGAEIVLSESIEPTLATDAEWPLLVHRVDPARVGFLACEGLEFETADRFELEIELAGGVEQWLERTYETPAEWEARLRLATDSVAVICRLMR